MMISYFLKGFAEISFYLHGLFYSNLDLFKCCLLLLLLLFSSSSQYCYYYYGRYDYFYYESFCHKRKSVFSFSRCSGISETYLFIIFFSFYIYSNVTFPLSALLNLLKPNGYIRNTDFNTLILCITPTKCICKFDTILTINSCCFPN
jgi:hypothetical protein